MGSGVVISLRTSSTNAASVARRLRTRGSDDRLIRQVRAFLVSAYRDGWGGGGSNLSVSGRENRRPTQLVI